MNIPDLGKFEKIQIQSYAQSVIRAVSKCIIIDPLLMSIKQLLRQAASKGINIQLRWVSGHSDIFGNEFVDKITKRVVDVHNCVAVAILKRDVKRMIKQKINKEEINVWNKVTSYIAKQFFPHLYDIASFVKSNPSVEVYQFVSCHCKLSYHSWDKFNQIASPKCACGSGKEIVEHYLFECLLYDTIREEVWGN